MSAPVATSDDWDEKVRTALAGDEAAWRDIVDRLSGVVWKVLNTYSLDQADREDAFASTFFKLYEKLGTVRDSNYLPGWIATVARNEANSIWRVRGRTEPVEELPIRELEIDTTDEMLLESELIQTVMKAFGTLPADGQALLRLLTTVPPLSYNEIADQLDMPKGSIGPTAGRHLAQLRRLLTAYNSGGLA